MKRATASIVLGFTYISNAYTSSNMHLKDLKKATKKNYVASAWRDTGKQIRQAMLQGRKNG